MEQVFLITKKGSQFTGICPDFELLKDTLEAELEKAAEGEQFIIQIADPSREEIKKALKEDVEFEGF